jgi:predicted TIM-barrel fold metal-dependent hydrolase
MRDSAWGFPIVDFHCHFPVPDPAPQPVEEAYRWQHGERKLARLRQDWRWYQEQWWDHYSFPYPEESEPAPDIQAGRWSAEIETAGLEAVAFMTGGGNKALAGAIAGYPRMYGFAHHDPFSPGAADELRRAITEDGLRGYKVIAPALAGAIDDDALLPVWQAAEDLEIPVLVHFGTLDGGGGTGAHVNISPLRLHDVAKAFPYTTFVVPHFGCGYPGDLLQLAWACRNVCVDSSGNKRVDPLDAVPADACGPVPQVPGDDRAGARPVRLGLRSLSPRAGEGLLRRADQDRQPARPLPRRPSPDLRP